MRYFVAYCLTFMVIGVLMNTVLQHTHGPLYPAIDVALCTVTGGFIGLIADFCGWLLTSIKARLERRPFMRSLGIRLLVLGAIMILMVALSHADQKNISPADKDETLLIPVLLGGGFFGIGGAAIWYLADRDRQSR